MMSFIITALIMFAFWILLSGEYNPIMISSGIVSSLFVAYLSHDLLIGKTDIRLNMIRIIKFVAYLPWLFWSIVLANIDLAYRTLHPKMPINPRTIRLKNNFRTEMGVVTLANSITLTPGSVTIDANKDEFVVHIIEEGVAESLMSGEMQRRVKRIEGLDV